MSKNQQRRTKLPKFITIANWKRYNSCSRKNVWALPDIKLYVLEHPRFTYYKCHYAEHYHLTKNRKEQS